MSDDKTSKPTARHFKKQVVFMSRATAREVWLMRYGAEPDLTGDLYFGESKIKVVLDDHMELGTARLLTETGQE